MNLYPFKFEPILKKVIWGGSEIGRFKHLDISESGIGESWELSQVSGSVSVITNGELKGKSLTDIIEAEPQTLLGAKNFERFGNIFPLLIKFIDAENDLSIQVHPDDELAAKRHHSFGKTEMWYVIASKPGSRLVSGFSEQIDAEDYERRISDGSIEEVLNYHDVKPGDVFFLPAGRVHAIGAGLLIAEIQQSSDITYRLYDYNRKDAQGKVRDLHTELAKDAIDYRMYSTLKTAYKPVANEVVPLVSCPYFTTNRIQLKADEADVDIPGVKKERKQPSRDEMVRDYTNLDSFVVYVGIKGEGIIQYENGQTIPITQGETVLLPASIKRTILSTNRELLLLETYIL